MTLPYDNHSPPIMGYSLTPTSPLISPQSARRSSLVSFSTLSPPPSPRICRPSDAGRNIVLHKRGRESNRLIPKEYFTSDKHTYNFNNNTALYPLDCYEAIHFPEIIVDNAKAQLTQAKPWQPVENPTEYNTEYLHPYCNEENLDQVYSKPERGNSLYPRSNSDDGGRTRKSSSKKVSISPLKRKPDTPLPNAITDSPLVNRSRSIVDIEESKETDSSVYHLCDWMRDAAQGLHDADSLHYGYDTFEDAGEVMRSRRMSVPNLETHFANNLQINDEGRRRRAATLPEPPGGERKNSVMRRSGCFLNGDTKKTQQNDEKNKRISSPTECNRIQPFATSSSIGGKCGEERNNNTGIGHEGSSSASPQKAEHNKLRRKSIPFSIDRTKLEINDNPELKEASTTANTNSNEVNINKNADLARNSNTGIHEESPEINKNNRRKSIASSDIKPGDVSTYKNSIGKRRKSILKHNSKTNEGSAYPNHVRRVSAVENYCNSSTYQTYSTQHTNMDSNQQRGVPVQQSNTNSTKIRRFSTQQKAADSLANVTERRLSVHQVNPTRQRRNSTHTCNDIDFKNKLSDKAVRRKTSSLLKRSQQLTNLMAGYKKPEKVSSAINECTEGKEEASTIPDETTKDDDPGTQENIVENPVDNYVEPEERSEVEYKCEIDSNESDFEDVSIPISEMAINL